MIELKDNGNVVKEINMSIVKSRNPGFKYLTKERGELKWKLWSRQLILQKYTTGK